jgi:bacteriophage exclusion system BrxA-like protein
MSEFSYDSDLVGGSLMVRESRIVADLLLSNATPEEWEQAIMVDNRLQKRAPATAKRIAQSIRKRLERMEPEFWRALRDGDDDLATQVAFCAALERNLLLVEFMERVVSDAYVTHAEKLETYQWDDFLEDCAYRDSAIHDWTRSSKKKMGQVVFRMLAEMGYVADTATLKLQNVIIRPEIKAMLADNYKHRLNECLNIAFSA